MAEELVELLRRVGLSRILAIEKRDPQYLAVCRVCENRGTDETARLVMLNALISYRLTGKGEEHWMYFADFFSTRRNIDICKEFFEYISKSPYLILNRNARMSRVRKACGIKPDIDDLIKTWNKLALTLDVDPNSKTVVFALKMLNYVYMCCRGVDRPVPFEIPIPVDYRVARMTSCLGLIAMAPEEAMRRYREIQTVWRRIAEASGIPPLHIDTLLWLAARAVLYSDTENEVPRELVEFFKRFCKG